MLPDNAERDSLSLAKEKHYTIVILLLCVIPMLSLMAAAIYSEHDFMSNSEMRWVNTFFLLVPLLLLVINGWIVLALYAFASTLFFFKTLLTMGAISNSTLNMMALILGGAFFIRRRSIHSVPGLIPYLLLLSLIFVQFFRTEEIIAGINVVLGAVTIGLFFYVIAPRLHVGEAIFMLKAYLLGFVLFGLFLLLSYDWGVGARMGESLGLDANNVGLFAASASVISLYLHLDKRLSLWWGSWPFVIASILLVLSSSRSFIIVTVIGLLLLFGKKNFALKGAISLGVLMVVIFTAISYYFDSDIARHLTRGVESDTDVELESVSALRWYLLQAGIELFTEKPFLGFGVANFADAAGISAYEGGQNLVAHNIYLSSAVELGVVGLILLLIWNGRCLWEGYRSGAVFGVTITIMYCLVGLLSGNYLDVEYAFIWGVAFVVAATPPQR